MAVSREPGQPKPPRLQQAAGGKGHGRVRRSWIVLAVILVIVVVGFAAVVFLSNRSQAASEPSRTESFSNLSREHTYDSVSYEQSPPVGGPHYPVWENCGFYDEPVQNEKAVYSMEHGAVWITYHPDLPKEQVDKLRQLARDSNYLLVSPYPELPAPVVASAWGKQLKVDSVDDPRLEQFIKAFEQGPQTPERGASCSGATEMNPPAK
jgi:hypothetical protein